MSAEGSEVESIHLRRRVQASRNSIATPTDVPSALPPPIPSFTARFLEITLDYLPLAFITFGGPPAHIAILHELFVTRKRWLSESMFAELFAISSSLPGPASTQMAYTVALLRGGILPAIWAFLIWSIPGALVMTTVGILVGGSPGSTLPFPVLYLQNGLGATAVALIALASFNLGSKICGDRVTKSIAVATASLTSVFPGRSWLVPVLMVLGGCVTYLQSLVQSRRLGEANHAVEVTTPERSSSVSPDHEDTPGSPVANERAVDEGAQAVVDEIRFSYTWQTGLLVLAGWLVLFIAAVVTRSLNVSRTFTILPTFFFVGSVIFGGGPVVVPLLYSYVVEPGWASSSEFLLGLALINALPGPNFNFAAYCGAISLRSRGVGPAALGAFLAWTGIFLPGLLIKTAVLPLWRRSRGFPTVQTMFRGVNAAAVGLVFTATYLLWQKVIQVSDGGVIGTRPLGDVPLYVAVMAVTFLAVGFLKVPAPLVIVGDSSAVVEVPMASAKERQSSAPKTERSLKSVQHEEEGTDAPEPTDPGNGKSNLSTRRTVFSGSRQALNEAITRVVAWHFGVILTYLAILGLCIASILVGKAGIELPVQPGYYLSGARLVLGMIVQISLSAPMELVRRICQILFARRLTGRGMTSREMLTAWSAIYSNNYRGIEDLHLQMGPITALLLFFYFAEIVAIGSIGLLSTSSPVNTVKAQGHVPTYGPLQSTDTFSARAQDAIFGVGRLCDPIVQQAMLMPPQKACPEVSSTLAAASGAYTSCQSIVASSLTLPDLTNTQFDDSALQFDWTYILPGDIFEGVFSTVGVTATCSSLSAAGVTGSTSSAFKLMLTLPNGEIMASRIPFLNARDASFTTPTVQIQELARSPDYTEPFVTDSGSLYVGLVAYNFAETFSDMTTVHLPLQDGSGNVRNISVALCELQVTVGSANAGVQVISAMEQIVPYVMHATYAAEPTLFDMSGGTGYGTAQFVSQALMEMSCDVLPCTQSSTSPPGFNLLTGLIERTSDNAGWTVDYDHQLATITQALARLSTLLISTYVEASDIFDVDPTSQTIVTSLLFKVSLQITSNCELILLVGAISSCLILTVHIVGRLSKATFARHLYPPTLWVTESIHSLLLLLQQTPPPFVNDVNKPGGVDSNPEKLREAASKRLLVGKVDSETGVFSITIKQINGHA
ncbi:hypothetical protein HKX48_003182 [Thoreauomyces humboldtii]|nr:hypothetical protein HKX48_003182 [Thoreauomyces humboldtii]